MTIRQKPPSRTSPTFRILTDEGVQPPPSFHDVRLTRIAESLLNDHAYTGEVSLVLTDDTTIRRLNQRYRGIDRPTDVLSFDLSDDDGRTGEIYVALPTAERQANMRGIPVVEEIYRLSIHGLLHLTGYDDQTEEENVEMVRETERYLSHLIGLVKECDSKA
jgi:probable rRNA maturation factor